MDVAPHVEEFRTAPKDGEIATVDATYHICDRAATSLSIQGHITIDIRDLPTCFVSDETGGKGAHLSYIVKHTDSGQAVGSVAQNPLDGGATTVKLGARRKPARCNLYVNGVVIGRSQITSYY